MILFCFKAGHGDNVHDGTARGGGWLNACNKFLCDQVLHTDNKIKQKRFSLFDLHASTTPPDASRFSVVFVPPCILEENSVTGSHKRMIPRVAYLISPGLFNSRSRTLTNWHCSRCKPSGTKSLEAFNLLFQSDISRFKKSPQ